MHKSLTWYTSILSCKTVEDITKSNTDLAASLVHLK
jgi:hypothetical protein